MPEFVADFNRFCAKHLGYIILALASFTGSAATAAVIYYGDLSDALSTVEERSVSTQRQLERHMGAEARYQREVRDILRSISSNLSMTREDVAVLRARVDE